MKSTYLFKTIMLSAILASFSIACTNKKEKAEEQQEAQAGDVYDDTQQGVEHENRDNQFPESRNDNKEGNGLETGAPTDTIDGDGDMGTKPAKQ
ncbi:hypothetical protein LRS05_14480 [Flavobacterium sp. J372]|uniref:hypothetical protein n=1 Tax=Flavobacterium sp. J372 TaxID=2898436 RepID=UPI002150D12B|nr:hypothetical protein [Flavobacterium sp. J372]MCR5863252.1 hypothetical protein [Flavobacterium sp. J372]